MEMNFCFNEKHKKSQFCVTSSKWAITKLQRSQQLRCTCLIENQEIKANSADNSLSKQQSAPPLQYTEI